MATLAKLLVLQLVFAWVLASLGRERNAMTSCIKKRTIYIVPDIEIRNRHSSLQPRLSKLSLLMKALVRDPCINLWTYSVIQRQFIRMTELNIQHLLDTEIAVYSGLEGHSEWRDFVLKIPTSNETIEQVIVYIDFYLRSINQKNRERSLVLKDLIYLQNIKKLKVIVLSPHRRLFIEVRNWLPSHRFFRMPHLGFQRKAIDQNVQKDLLDLLKNPDHDRFQQYDKLECMHDRKWALYISGNKRDKDKDDQTNDENGFDFSYLAYFFEAIFPNLNKFYLKDFYQKNVTVGYTYMNHINVDTEYNFILWIEPPEFIHFVKEQGTAIHIDIKRKESKVIRDPQPFTNDETINVILDNNIAKSSN